MIIERAFWRDEKTLSEDERRLLDLLAMAHAECAKRQNASSAQVVNTFAGSGDYNKSIAAALLTLGERHGPIAEAYLLLNSREPANEAATLLSFGLRVPGWGSSFFKDGVDPAWSTTNAHIAERYPQIMHDIICISDLLLSNGKKVYPNAACYTAAAAKALGIPGRLSPMLFIMTRLETWSELILQNCDVR